MRLVIFDVDGTLVDSQHHILQAMAGAFGALGLPAPPRHRVLGIIGLSLPEAMAGLAPDLDAGRQAALVGAYKDGFNRNRAAEPALYPGARDALLALAGQDDVALGVATGNSRRGLARVIETHGLQGLFVTRQTADQHPSKPHPAMIAAALAEAGCDAADAVMVGDTTFDMAMARAAGVAGLGVGWGYHPAAALRAAGAGQVAGSFDDLSRALESIWGGA